MISIIILSIDGHKFSAVCRNFQAVLSDEPLLSDEPHQLIRIQ